MEAPVTNSEPSEVLRTEGYHSGLCEADNICSTESEEVNIKKEPETSRFPVSLDDAKLGLLKVIVYLEAHPVFPRNHIQFLWKLLKDIEEQSCDEQDASAEDFEPGEEDESFNPNDLKNELSLEPTHYESDTDEEQYQLSDVDVATGNGTHVEPSQPVKIHSDKASNTKTESSSPSDAKDITSELSNTISTVEKYEGSKMKKKRIRSGLYVPVGERNMIKKKKIPKNKSHHKQYICPVCDQRFKQDVQLTRHLLVHSTGSDKPYICRLCGKAFDHPSHLVCHERIHTGEKPFKCERCDRGFKTNNQCVVHQQTHDNKRQFVCSICGKGFNRRSHLACHERIHTGEKPFICPICAKRFSQIGGLQNHSRTHTGEKPYLCTECGKNFTNYSSWKAHRRSHTGERPYPCPMCERTFGHTSSLEAHVKSHTGEKPYQCAECGKCYADNKSLKSHTRAHMNDPPFDSASEGASGSRYSAQKTSAFMEGVGKTKSAREGTEVSTDVPENRGNSKTIDRFNSGDVLSMMKHGMVDVQNEFRGYGESFSLDKNLVEKLSNSRAEFSKEKNRLASFSDPVNASSSQREHFEENGDPQFPDLRKELFSSREDFIRDDGAKKIYTSPKDGHANTITGQVQDFSMPRDGYTRESFSGHQEPFPVATSRDALTSPREGFTSSTETFVGSGISRERFSRDDQLRGGMDNPYRDLPIPHPAWSGGVWCSENWQNK